MDLIFKKEGRHLWDTALNHMGPPLALLLGTLVDDQSGSLSLLPPTLEGHQSFSQQKSRVGRATFTPENAGKVSLT